ncbi:MAG: grasp-with-spasm system SPASM domain peptide maturase [Bacteroidia bacterium]
MARTNELTNSGCFLLHSCCIPVKGYCRSIMYDLNRGSFSYIPNDMFNLLNTWNGYSKEDVLDAYEPEDRAVLLEYFDYLEKEEFIFYIDSKEEMNLFPKMDLSFDYPALISNAILQFENEISYDLGLVIQQLNELGCRDAQLVFYGSTKLEFILDCLKEFQTSSFKTLELVLPHSDCTSFEGLSELSEIHKRIRRFFVFESDRSESFMTNKNLAEVIYSEEQVEYVMYHVIDTTELFRVTPDLFFEAQQYNPYLNKKMCIDKNGNIRNAPNSERIFGHVSKISLPLIIRDLEFRNLWTIGKDEIKLCRDCEYRYMCTDCRIPVNVEGEWTYDQECGYDVINGFWR